jgi:hypothetical protein
MRNNFQIKKHEINFQTIIFLNFQISTFLNYFHMKNIIVYLFQ